MAIPAIQRTKGEISLYSPRYKGQDAEAKTIGRANVEITAADKARRHPLYLCEIAYNKKPPTIGTGAICGATTKYFNGTSP
ncbi:hypothetical protein FACS1894130_10200 [Spirochaetia bacterium]|nr:hypothetical protein FACS1894130_10200 [Spirochaetia bacterium]